MHQCANAPKYRGGPDQAAIRPEFREVAASGPSSGRSSFPTVPWPSSSSSAVRAGKLPGWWWR